jgi:hypothetical protein
MHGFETDDTVTFKEVSGMTEMNKVQCKIKGMFFSSELFWIVRF